MRLATLVFLGFTFALAGCGDRSPEDACSVVCEKNAICQPGSNEASCNAICLDLAKDESYAAALSEQADCYEDQSDYYADEKGVCVAIEGGVCQVMR